MNRRTTWSTTGAASGVRQTAAAALAVLGLLVTTLSITVATATSAQAAAIPANADNSRYSYTRVMEKHSYLLAHVARGKKILHVDEEHDTAEGFWFASKTNGDRGFYWTYQPYGKWCLYPSAKLTFNGWMNTHWCGPDLESAENSSTGFTANTMKCRVDTGYPWKQADAGGSRYACYDDLFDYTANPITQAAGTLYDCAPWETKGLDRNGSPLCLKDTYPWVNDAPNTFWMPAPDPCTGMPTDANIKTPSYDPAHYAPQAGGDGSCTGEAFAPNCDAAGANTQSQACTGVPMPEPPATVTRSATVTVTGSAKVTATKYGQVRVLRWWRDVRVTKWRKGKRFTATSRAKIWRSLLRSHTVTVSRSASATATASGTCTKPTYAEAEECALAAARSKAKSAAKTKATSAARSKAESAAGTSAKKQAVAKSRRAGRTSKVWWSHRKPVVQQHRKIANRKVNRKIRNYFH